MRDASVACGAPILRRPPSAPLLEFVGCAGRIAFMSSTSSSHRLLLTPRRYHPELVASTLMAWMAVLVPLLEGVPALPPISSPV